MVMARVINFNNIPVLITGDHPVIDLILKELSPFPSTNKSAEIKFNITLSEIHPERGSLNLGSGIYATKDSLYIDLSKDFYYYIKISKDQNSWRWNIDISCTTTGIPNNPFGRFFEFLHKIKDWTYLTEIEKMAYHIINGVFEPFILFLTRGERTFLHASSIVKDNDAVLISGRGGTGKTSTCVELVCESG